MMTLRNLGLALAILLMVAQLARHAWRDYTQGRAMEQQEGVRLLARHRALLHQLYGPAFEPSSLERYNIKVELEEVERELKRRGISI